MAAARHNLSCRAVLGAVAGMHLRTAHEEVAALAGGERCFAALKADARRLADGG